MSGDDVEFVDIITEQHLAQSWIYHVIVDTPYPNNPPVFLMHKE